MKMERDKIVTRSLGTSSSEINRIAEKTNKDDIFRIVDLIKSCKRNVILTGAGTSGVAARKIVHSLRCQEIPSYYLSPSDGLHGGSGAFQEGDLLFAISNGGESKEINALVEIARQRGTCVVAVTKSGDNSLSRLSQEHLLVNVQKESDNMNLLATASILTVIAVFDAICSVIMVEKGFTREKFSIIHPEGKVGDDLSALS